MTKQWALIRADGSIAETRFDDEEPISWRLVSTIFNCRRFRPDDPVEPGPLSDVPLPPGFVPPEPEPIPEGWTPDLRQTEDADEATAWRDEGFVIIAERHHWVIEIDGVLIAEETTDDDTPPPLHPLGWTWIEANEPIVNPAVQDVALDGTVSPNLVGFEAQLIDEVKRAIRAQIITPAAREKDIEYTNKRIEVSHYLAGRRASYHFPYAWVEAGGDKDRLAEVIGRYRAAIEAVDAINAPLGALEQEVVAAIRAGETIEEKRAAAIPVLGEANV